MSLVVSEKVNYTPAPAGLHPAICICVADVGIQATPYGNKQQIVIVWELPETLMDDGRPFTLSRRFSPSLSKKATLRTILESWRGRAFTAEELRGFELKRLLGKPCQIMVQHAPSADGSRTYANVATVVPIAKGVSITPTVEPLYFDMDDPDLEVKAKLPDWIVALVDLAVPPQEKAHSSYATEQNHNFNDELNF